MPDDLKLRATIEAVLDDRGFKQLDHATSNAIGQFDKMGESVSHLGHELLAIFAAGAIVELFKESYIEAANFTRNVEILESRLREFGGTVEVTAEEVRHFIEALGEQTGMLDANLIPAMNRLLLATKDVVLSQGLLELAAKFAANGIGDVETNAQKLSIALQRGTTRSLVEFGVVTRDAAGESISFADAIRQLLAISDKMEEHFDDAKTRIGLFARVWESLKVRIGDAEEAVAKFWARMDAGTADEEDEAARREFKDEEEDARLQANWNKRIQRNAIVLEAEKRDAAVAEALQKASLAKQLAQLEDFYRDANAAAKSSSEAIWNLDQQTKLAESKLIQKSLDDLKAKTDRATAIRTTAAAKTARKEIEWIDATTETTMRSIRIRTQLEQKYHDARVALAASSAASIAGSLSTIFNDSKGFAVAQTTIETFYAAQLAYRDTLQLGGPYAIPLAYAAAAAAVAAGLARVAQIEGIGFDDPANDALIYTGTRRWARDMAGLMNSAFADEFTAASARRSSATVVNQYRNDSPVTNTTVNISGFVGAGRTEMLKRLQRDLDLAGRTVIKRSRIS